MKSITFIAGNSLEKNTTYNYSKWRLFHSVGNEARIIIKRTNFYAHITYLPVRNTYATKVLHNASIAYMSCLHNRYAHWIANLQFINLTFETW